MGIGEEMPGGGWPTLFGFVEVGRVRRSRHPAILPSDLP